MYFLLHLLKTKMDYAAIAYSLVVTAGGVMGYVKKGSIVSGLMGLACGGLIGKISTDGLS